MRVKMEADIEVYPDGEIYLTIGESWGPEFKFTTDEIVSSIRENLAACDFLTKDDLRGFIAKLQEIVDELHD